MKLVVSDTNIFIDLLNTDLLEKFLELPIEVHTTDFVISELKDEQAEVIIKKATENKIHIIEASDVEYDEIINQKKEKETLSIVDHSVYYYAKKLSAMILTGDKTFRKYAEVNKIEVKGILWTFDELNKKKLMGKEQLAQKLTTLMGTNKRLPLDECNNRIKKWKN